MQNEGKNNSVRVSSEVEICMTVWSKLNTIYLKSWTLHEHLPVRTSVCSFSELLQKQGTAVWCNNDWRRRRDSCHLPHPTCCWRPEGDSQFHASPAENWWSEVTILGHGLNGSNKNRLLSNGLLLRSARETGPIVWSLQHYYYTLKGVFLVYCMF